MPDCIAYRDCLGNQKTTVGQHKAITVPHHFFGLFPLIPGRNYSARSIDISLWACYTSVNFATFR